jgi:signal transduction histidine kinase
MKNDRAGLLMISATLVAIAVIVAAFFLHQRGVHAQQIRLQGVVLARSLSSLPLEQLLSRDDRPGILRTLVGVQRSPDFAYGLIVSTSGARLAEVTAPGTLIPAATMPAEPSGWFGEQTLVSPEDGRAIVEFRAPVMAAGAHAGFVRIGYRAELPMFATQQVSFAALLALPVFLLSPLSYFLMRREVRPLADLRQQIRTMQRPGEQQLAALADGQRTTDFAEGVGRLLGLMDARVRELESERIDSVASNRTLSYRQDRTEAVLHSLHDGVLILDASGVPTFVNAKVEPLLDVPPGQIAGRPAFEWCRTPELLPFLTRAQGEPGPLETALEPAPGRHLAVATYPLYSPLDPSTRFGTLVVLRDVSQEQHAREAGAQFVANVSHELKTPLNTIASYSEMLMDAPNLTEALRVEAVNVIHDEVERMALLINNMLNISKLETGAMALDSQRVNLRDLLRDAFESLRQSAVGGGLDFRIEVPPNLGLAALDKDLFRIALNNLLSNAIKYNRPGGHVTLAAEETEDGYFNIFVRDAGIGIAAEQCERIFDKFYRVGNADAAAASGHGLGLYLAKQIVDLHHGRLTVQSEPGKGTEFCVQVKKQMAPYQEAVAA